MIERKVNIHKLSDYDEVKANRNYWLSRSPEERVSAVEILRRQFHGNTERLQRVAGVVQLSQS